ncbi:PQQ-dependent sugar dehydrogenase [Robiginitalea sp. M366]|uniref:PQQ-dependent sugar dehydrogenase n=1 Tax=Robiginitalea aestuariiviva TaxID=3036903 RepID=UPI00240CF81E|nr:PQQ-dependent sugar dehydrogenase [Robiginitalea aestuariiviva]MDG1573346.1 PQQ-dependent sugar dehydrogenase [Robiginitalea aestuariiviva]
MKSKSCFFRFLSLGLGLITLALPLSCGPESKGKPSDTGPVAARYAGGELSIQHGMEVFNRHCASCHNFQASEIGPNLSGVTSQVDKAWLVAYIQDPKAMIDGGDPRAAALFERYRMYMPGFPHLQGEDMEHLLGFIHKFSEAEKRNTSNRTGGLVNPIPQPIPEAGLALELEEWFTAPPTATEPLLARINKLDGIGGRLFLADQRGILYEINGDTVHSYLDLKAKTPAFIDTPGFGSGLGSFAFHPAFEANGLLYTTHTEKAGSARADFALPDSIPAALQWVLTEWQATDPGKATFAGSRREVLRADMTSQIHGFQELTFNPLAQPSDPDYGLLYLGIGDGGAALGGHPELCDNSRHIWGSVIRIDPGGRSSANGQYGIPEGNPFLGQEGALGEIWARGFRNPHRMTWDRGGSHQMFISNIGQHSVEEINLGRAGADYGWPVREGTFLFDVHANSELVYPLDKPDTLFTGPALQYDHDEGNAVSGGYAYRGMRVPELQGWYLFGDIPRGTLFGAQVAEMDGKDPATVYRVALRIDGEATTLAARSLHPRVDLRFAQDASGELYLFTKNDGKVYRVAGAKKP